jgi:hypothetical protein
MRGSELFTHFLITRFNINMAGLSQNKNGQNIIDEQWLLHRIQFFERFCLPSINNQSVKNFFWLVFFDMNSPSFLMDKIKHWENSCVNFKAIFVKDYDSFLKHEISDAINKYRDSQKNYIITTRIDNDDAFHSQAISTIQKYFDPRHRTIIDLEKGYCLSIQPLLLYKLNKKSNPFVSLIEDVREVENIASVMSEEHQLWIDKAPFISIKNKQLWIQVIHEKNLMNAARGSILLHKGFVKEFGFTLAAQNFFWHSLKHKTTKAILLIKHYVKMILISTLNWLPCRSRVL